MRYLKTDDSTLRAICHIGNDAGPHHDGIRAGLRILVVTNLYPSDDNPSRGTFVKEQVDSLIEFCPELTVDVFVIDGYKSKLEYFRAMHLVPRIAIKNQRCPVRLLQCSLNIKS